MTARNDITGDSIATKGTTDLFRDNYDRIFKKGIYAEKKQLAADIGPIETPEILYFQEEMALEELRTRMAI